MKKFSSVQPNLSFIQRYINFSMNKEEPNMQGAKKVGKVRILFMGVCIMIHVMFKLIDFIDI